MTRASITSDAEPDQQITIYTAEPGSPSEQVLRNLRERWLGALREAGFLAGWTPQTIAMPGQSLGCLRSADVDQVVGASLTVVHTVIGFS